MSEKKSIYHLVPSVPIGAFETSQGRYRTLIVDNAEDTDIKAKKLPICVVYADDLEECITLAKAISLGIWYFVHGYGTYSVSKHLKEIEVLTDAKKVRSA